jgi:hypothetical protein
MNRAVWDSMWCMKFPSLVRFAVLAVDPRTEEVIDTMEYVRFRRRKNAEWWVSQAAPLTAAEYRILEVPR